MMANSKSVPIVYVLNHRVSRLAKSEFLQERAECGTQLKNSKGGSNYNLTIPYGMACDVLLADIVRYTIRTMSLGAELPNR